VIREGLESWWRIAARWGTADLALVLWLAAAAAWIGNRFLERLGLTPGRGLAGIAFSTAAGLPIVSWGATLLAALHLLRAELAVPLLALPILLWWRGSRRARGRRTVPPVEPDPATPPRIGTLAGYLLLAYAACVLGVVLISALGPEIEYDPLIMHLETAQVCSPSASSWDAT
jgi:hypothetical protein